MKTRAFRGALLALIWVVGCSGESMGVDASGADAASDHDAGRDAAVPIDASDAATDVGNDAGVLPDFRLDSVDTRGCVGVDSSGVVGSPGTANGAPDRDGIAVSDESVLVTGTQHTGVFPLDLPRGALPTEGNDLVADLGSGALYLLADATGPIGRVEETAHHVTRLLRARADASPDTGEIALSQPIDVDITSGIFAGDGEIALSSGASVFVVELASGAVTEITDSPLSGTFLTCNHWHGVLERVGGHHAIVGAALAGIGTRAILRLDLTTHVATTIRTFDDLGLLCSLTVAPATNRWYFEHAGYSQLVSGIHATTRHPVGYCDATFASSGDDFAIASLETTGCNALDSAPLVGDDDGTIVVTSTNVYATGSDGLARWSLDLDDATTSAPAATTRGIVDALVTDLHGGHVWALATSAGLVTNDGGDVTHLVLLDAAAAETSTVVTLSRPVSLPFDGVGLFAGWDEIAMHDGEHAWLVSLPSGVVTDLGAMPRPTHPACTSWAYWGVVERFGGARYLVTSTGAAAPGDVVAIARFTVPSGVRQDITTLDGSLGYLCAFSLSPARDRWYFHVYGAPPLAMTTGTETLAYCGAATTHP